MRSIKKGNPQNDEKMRSINIYYFLQRQIFYYQKLSVPLPFQIKSFIFGFWRIRIQAVMGLSVVHSYQSEILTQMKILQRGAANGSYPRPPFPPKTIITQKSYSASSVVPLWGTLYTTFIFELYSLHYGKHTYVYIYSVWLCMLRHFFLKRNVQDFSAALLRLYLAARCGYQKREKSLKTHCSQKAYFSSALQGTHLHFTHRWVPPEQQYHLIHKTQLI